MNIQRASNVKSRPRLPIPDEDPYSIAGHTRISLIDASDSSGYGGSSNQQHLQHGNGGGTLAHNGHADDIVGGGGGVSGNYDRSSSPHDRAHFHTYESVCVCEQHTKLMGSDHASNLCTCVASVQWSVFV